MLDRCLISGGVAALTLALAGSPVLAQHSHGHSEPAAATAQPDSKAGHDESASGHAHDKAMLHGGQVTMTPSHHVEVLFTDAQARLYIYDAKQMPIADPKNVQGTLVLTTKAGKPETLALKYQPPSSEQGRVQGYFYADRDFSGVTAGDMKATLKLTGLAKEPVEFRTAVAIGHAMSYACPMNCVPAAEDPMRCPKCGMNMVAVPQGEPAEKHAGHTGGH